LILLNFYIASNIITGLISVVSIFIFRIKRINNPLLTILVLWYFIKFLSDILATIIDLIFHKNPIPIFHVSTLLETILMVLFFNLLTNKFKKITSIFLIFPLFATFFDVVVNGTIFEISTFGHVLSFLLTSFLLFILLTENKTINQQYLKIIRVFFFYHTIVLFYSIFQDVIRSDSDYFDYCYPIFFLTNLLMNFYPFFLLWSTRKN
jgi:hypothetical protein